METKPYNTITSKDNSRVKQLRSLQEPKHRRKEGVFLIEGVKVVEEALRDNLVKTVIASPALLRHHGKGVLKLAESRRVEVLWISDKLFSGISESVTPQPVMAVVPMRFQTEESLFDSEAGLIVIADRLQDPGNLGTLIRTTEAAGASGVGITGDTVDPYNAKTIRASMGSILRIPVVSIRNSATFIEACRQKGYQTVATTLKGSETHFNTDLRKRTVLIFGQEAGGLSPALLPNVDLHIRIPMAETVESLNVATAAAVILYEAMRQRNSSTS